MSELSREQQLVDLIFEVALKTWGHPWFKDKSVEEVAEWIRSQLKADGFEVVPRGMSHGVLVKEGV